MRISQCVYALNFYLNFLSLFVSDSLILPFVIIAISHVIHGHDYFLWMPFNSTVLSVLEMYLMKSASTSTIAEVWLTKTTHEMEDKKSLYAQKYFYNEKIFIMMHLELKPFWYMRLCHSFPLSRDLNNNNNNP